MKDIGMGEIIKGNREDMWMEKRRSGPNTESWRTLRTRNCGDEGNPAEEIEEE